MIGIVLWLASAITRTGMSVRNVFKDVNESQKAKENKKLTYFDTNGCQRLVSNHEAVYESHNPFGDHVINKNGKVLINISEQERQKRFDEAKRNNNPDITAIFWDEHYKKYKNPCETKEIKGARYKDIETGRLMVIKSICGHDFFLDTQTKKVIRRSDKEISLAKQAAAAGRKYYKTDWHVLMDNFNKEIDRIMEKKEDYYWANIKCDENVCTYNDYYYYPWKLSKSDLEMLQYSWEK